MLFEDDWENEDVEMVFESMRAARAQKAQEAHQEELTSFWRDGLRIGELDHFKAKDWDVSLLSAEERAALPKEQASHAR